MINPWVISVFIGTIFFVCGQVYLKSAFDSKITEYFSSLYVACCFSIMIGIAGTILLLFLYYRDPLFFDLKSLDFLHNSKSAIIAGIFFFFGNLFWIYSISTKHQLGMIRILMAGWEMLLLFLVGIFIFNEKFTFLQIFGCIMIFSGLSLVIYN